MYKTCVAEPGEPCLHESFLFAAGETRNGSVQLDIYRPDGRLSILTVSGFTSWKRVRAASGSRRPQAIRHVAEPTLIDCIIREEHCLTVYCVSVALAFFGREVRLETQQVAHVEPPSLFGDESGREYRRLYASYFVEHRKQAG